MDEEKKKALFEQVKKELRSILLSSKDGVPENLILSDYEMLSCQRLPYRELGCKNVAALLQSMPDVAKEIRLASGDVVYKAVSNESTAHIQRLVGNQKSAKKRVGRGRGRGAMRGRGTFSRGGRGGRGGSFRGSFNSRPLGFDAGRGSRGRGGGSFRGNSRFGGDTQTSDRGGGSFSSSYNSRGYGSNRGASRSTNSSFAGDVRGNLNNSAQDSHYISTSGSVWNESNWGGNAHSTKDRERASQDGWVDVDEDCHSRPGKNFDKDTSQGSPMVNLKIGLSSDGHRKIVAGSPIMTPEKHSLSREIDAVTPGGQIDLRGWLSNQVQVREKAKETADNPSDTTSANREHLSSYHTGGAGRKRVSPVASNINKELFKKFLPPRFMRQQQQQQKMSSKSYTEDNDSGVSFSTERNQPLQPQKALHTIGAKNWLPPEDGPRYLEAYYKFFADRGEPAPLINVVVGKVNKEKGFYGKLEHGGTCYYPLEIQSTAAQAKQNAARTFCITNKIALPSVGNGGTDYVKFASSEPSGEPSPQPAWMASLTQQLRASIDPTPAGQSQSSSPITPSSSSSSHSSATTPLRQNSSSSPGAAPQSKGSHLAKINENIYKMLKPGGTFVRSLAEVYEKTYRQSLDIDVLSHLQSRTDCFSLEEMIPGMAVVYAVTGADATSETNNNSVVDNNTPEASPNNTPEASPAASSAASSNETQDIGADSRLQLLEKGSELEVLFCYAYSTSEVYFQLALSEDIVYEIEETLNQMCPSSVPPDLALLNVGDPVAACYEGSWFRARVIGITHPQVQVYFIDYGNRESVNVSELRPLPEVEVTQATPPLALRCALSPAQATNVEDLQTQLEELSAAHPVLRAVVLDNSAEACVVELQLEDGKPVTLKSAPKSQPAISKKLQGQTSQVVSNSPDPEKLVIPDAEAFAVYICQIRSECTVMLRVVDDEYSDALDELEQAIGENFYQWSVPEEVKLRQVYAAMVLATADEAEDEGSCDQNKYHRVRVLRQNKDGTFKCILPDHSGEEILPRNQLREIDPKLNRSLPFQAVLATLRGLDQVEEALQVTAMEILLKLVNFTTPFYAVRHENSLALEIDLIDTDKDEEVNINESVIAALDEVMDGLAQGKSIKSILNTMFGSSSGSQADSASATSPSAVTEEGTEELQASLGRMSVTGEGDETQTRRNRVQDYVDELPVSSGTSGKLYTWNSDSIKPGPGSTPQPASSESKRLPALPDFWPYAFLKSVSLYITTVESPSHFVAIPLEQQGALEKVESAMAQYFSTSANVKAAEVVCEEGLYAVRSEGKYRRALYIGRVGGMAKVFFPDHHLFDTVEMPEVLSLPEQFYTLPFLAYKMRIKDMKPIQSPDWPDTSVDWFKQSVQHKALYAVVFSQDGCPKSSKHTSGSSSRSSSSNKSIIPSTLSVRLIDTSGEDDIIVDEMMAQLGLAAIDLTEED